MPDYVNSYVILPDGWSETFPAAAARVAGAARIYDHPTLVEGIWQIRVTPAQALWLRNNLGNVGGKPRFLGVGLAAVLANADVTLAMKARILRRQIARGELRLFLAPADQVAGDVVQTDNLPPNRWLGDGEDND